MRALAIIAALSLSACATCERHPVVCTAATIVAAGAVIAIAESHNQSQPQHVRDWHIN